MNRVRTVAVVGYCVLVFLAGVAGLVLTLAGDSGATGLSPVSATIFLSNPMVIVAVGGLLVIRRPDHWAGWTLLVIATAFVSASFAKAVLSGSHAGWAWARHLAGWGAWLDNWTWTVFYGGILFTVVQFAGGNPTASKAQLRLRRIGFLAFVPLVVMAVICALISEDVTTDGASVRTPIDVGLSNDDGEKLIFPLFLVVLAALVCAVIALVLHRRSATGVDRAQLRWIIWSFTTVVSVLVMAEAVRGVVALLGIDTATMVTVLDPVVQLTMFAIPIAIFVAVTRNGLFEIDRVISRTAAYSLLIATLTAGYAVLVTAATRILPDRLGSLGVAATTLAVAALFLPARRRLVLVIDRRFNRSRVDAERVVAAFAERMRRDETVDPTGTDLLTAVGTVFQPSSASVWLVRT